MNLSRKQQKLAAVAALGCLTVLIDRVFLAPSSAVADAPTPAQTHTAIASQTPAEPGVPEVDAPLLRTQLAERFQEIADERTLDPTQVPDAFQVPHEWLPNDGETTPPVVEDHPGVAEIVRKFKRTHRLNAVMANGRAGYAIVNEKRLRIGRKLDGFTLIEVRHRSIVLEGHGTRVELELPTRMRRND